MMAAHANLITAAHTAQTVLTQTMNTSFLTWAAMEQKVTFTRAMVVADAVIMGMQTNVPMGQRGAVGSQIEEAKSCTHWT